MSLRRTGYTPLRGADFSNNESMVDRNRAPICENIIPDGAGYPEKRCGWRTVKEYGDKIYGLHKYTYGGQTKMLVHAGKKLLDGETVLTSAMAESISRSYQDGDTLIILDGASYITCRSEEDALKVKVIGWDDTISNISQDGYKVGDGDYTDGGAYIPTTSIGSVPFTNSIYADETIEPPKADDGKIFFNGTALDSVNKLSKWRRMTACGYRQQGGWHMLILDGSAKIEEGAHDIGNDDYYQCDTVQVFIGGQRRPVFCYSGSTTWIYSLISPLVSRKGVLITKVKRSDFEYKDNDGDITMVIYAANQDENPDVVGRDNIEVYYVSDTDEDSDIRKCTTLSEYKNRIFVTGNPDKPNFDWHSEMGNPYYYPDLSYQKFGDGTRVVGYLNAGSAQAIIKADDAAGGSIYLRQESLLGDKYAYPVTQIKSGLGAVSPDGMCSFSGDDLVLTKQGIFAITSLDSSQEKVLSNRSWYVDGKLRGENHLENAVLFSHRGLCMCATGGNVYILNGNSSRSYNYKYDYLYDCYYWTGVPIERVLALDDVIWFSTGSKLRRFNTDIDGSERYNDDGAAIKARWGTKFDDDGDITRYKTMIKKGGTVTVKPYQRSSCKVYLRTETTGERQVKYGTADIFSWEDIDFERFTFESSESLREIIITAKAKKYKRLQIVAENDAVDEGFGIAEINKHYAFGNFIKR